MGHDFPDFQDHHESIPASPCSCAPVQMERAMIDDAEITISNDLLSLKRKGQSELITASILAVEVQGGHQVIYVDSLIHETYEVTLAGYQVKGAISTILSKPAFAS